MGFLDDMFGGTGQHYDAYRAAMSDSYGRYSDFANDMLARYRGLGTELRGEYEGLGEEARSVMMGLYRDMEVDRSRYLSEVDNQFSGVLTQLRSDLSSARESMEGYFDRAYDELATGRDASLELLAQQSATEAARAQQSAAFGGIGGTTTGQAQVSAAETQGALRQAAMREQYGAQLANQLNMAGQTLGQFDQNAIAQTTGLETARMNTYLSGYESYAQRMQGLRQGAETARLDLMQQGIGAFGNLAAQGVGSYEQQMGTYINKMVGMDEMIAGAQLKEGLGRAALGQQVIGMGIGALTGGLAGGFGSMMGGGGFGGGFSAGISNYFGGIGGGFGGAFQAGQQSVPA
jgi:hypothetical protein